MRTVLAGLGEERLRTSILKKHLSEVTYILLSKDVPFLTRRTHHLNYSITIEFL